MKTKVKKTLKRANKKYTEESFKVSGVNLLKTVKNLIDQGNIRHVTVKDKNEKVVMEFPLSVGVVGVAALPVLAAVGAVAALIAECTISVERVKE